MGGRDFPSSGVKYGGRTSPVKRRQEFVESTQCLARRERLPSEGEQRTACGIGHPGGQAPPVFDTFDEQLPLPSFGIELDCLHLLTEERMQRILDFDRARIAGII